MSGEAPKWVRTSVPAPGVLLAVLSRPERLNALDEGMRRELSSLCDEILAGYPGRYRAVVLSGEGRAFCSGGDVSYFRSIVDGPFDVVESFIAGFHQFARRWYELPIPTIAALNGVAAGGGAALALLCDLRIAVPDARIGFTFVKIGLIPDMGSHYLLPALVGRGRALELLCSGELVGAEEASRLGLVSRVVPREDLEAEAISLAARFAAAPPDAIRTIKELVREASRLPLAGILEREVTAQASRFKSPEFMEGIRRFLEKK